MTRSPRRTCQAAALAAAVAIAVAGALAACNPSASALPSVAIPSDLPALEVPSASLVASITGCVDPATGAVLNQLQQQGADVPTILAGNKDALITGLRAYEPPDAVTATWRDRLVAALQSGDMTTASTEVEMLSSGEVTIAAC